MVIKTDLVALPVKCLTGCKDMEHGYWKDRFTGSKTEDWICKKFNNKSLKGKSAPLCEVKE